MTTSPSNRTAAMPSTRPEVRSALTLWGGKALRASGYDLSRVPFWTGQFQQAALAAPVFADVTSVMDIGLVVGAFFGAGLAGRFEPSRRIPPSVAAAALLGGLLLGYGRDDSCGSVPVRRQPPRAVGRSRERLPVDVDGGGRRAPRGQGLRLG